MTKPKSKSGLAAPTGYASWMSYTDAQLTTRDLTIRQAARKANISCTLGFENVWLNDVKTKYGEARQIIGAKLLSMGFKPVRGPIEA